jgi:hypothetical protein
MQMLFHDCRRVEKGEDRLWMLPVNLIFFKKPV